MVDQLQHRWTFGKKLTLFPATVSEMPLWTISSTLSVARGLHVAQTPAQPSTHPCTSEYA